MISNNVKAKCPKCNAMVDANSFVLSYIERKMICQTCHKQKDKKVKPIIKKEKIQRPAGWDKEDEELERLVKAKNIKLTGKIERVPGEKHIRYNCPECNFKFRYFPLERRPRYCPYCSHENPVIRLHQIP